jgi:hypothetical protein
MPLALWKKHMMWNLMTLMAPKEHLKILMMSVMNHSGKLSRICQLELYNQKKKKKRCKISTGLLHQMYHKRMKKMRGMQMKIYLSLMNKRWYKPKMLMLQDLLKWLTRGTHHCYNHIHKISSLRILKKGLLLFNKNMLHLLNITPLFLVLSLHVQMRHYRIRTG